jgi:DNA polymerase III delta prime subunit
MADASRQHKRYLELGDAAVCLHFPNQAFAETACEHIFLTPHFEGPTIATIHYVVDDSVDDLLSFRRKKNVVYIDRKAMAGGHERVILGMFDAFTAVLELRGMEIIVRFAAQAPIQTLLDDVMQAALQPILHNLGGFILHGACMVRDMHAIVLMGNSGTGKSTTAFNLTRHGFCGYADDAVLVTPKDDALVVWPLTRELSLRPLSFKLFEKQGISLGRYQKVGEKYYFAQTTQTLCGAKLAHICFLELSGESETHIERLTVERTLEILDANDRHFSFMGRTGAQKYARILAQKVPAPLSVQLGTDLQHQGSVFARLVPDHNLETVAPKQPRKFVSSRSHKSALIRQAWSIPNQEPLRQLIPMLGDFDPKIFKLALGFFQTYPLAGIKVLAAPDRNKCDYTKDPAPWVRTADWADGCKILLERAGLEVLQKFAFSWLKSAPLLYPFLMGQLGEDTEASELVDQAWNRIQAQDNTTHSDQGNHIHLLNFHDRAIWTAPESNRWWQDQILVGQSSIHVYCWVAQEGSNHWEPLLPNLESLSDGSTVTIIPVINDQRNIASSIALVRKALTRGIRVALCRQTPLCCLANEQAHYLLEAGAFDFNGKLSKGQVRFFCKPGDALPVPESNNKLGITRVHTHARFEDSPYAECGTCRLFGFGLCRGGFFQCF